MADDTIDIVIRAKQQINAEFRDLETKLKGLETAADKAAGPGGFQKLTASVTSFTVGAIAGVVAGLGAATAAAIEYGGRLSDLSAKTDIGVETFGRWRYAAENSGIALETVAQAALELERRLATGDKGTVGAVEKLGINLIKLGQQDTAGKLETISAAFAKLETTGQRAAAAKELFGKAGVDLIPLLRQDLIAAGDAAERLGVLTEDNAAALDRLGDAWGDFKIASQVALGNAIGSTERLLERIDAGTPKIVKFTNALLSGDLSVLASATLPKVAEATVRVSRAVEPLTEGLDRQKKIEAELDAARKAGNESRKAAAVLVDAEAEALKRQSSEAKKQGEQLRTAADAIFPKYLDALARENALLRAGTDELIGRIQAEDVLLPKIERRSQAILATLGPQARGQNAGADASSFGDAFGLGSLFTGGNLGSMLLGGISSANPAGAIGGGLGSAAGGSLVNALGLSASGFLGTLLPGVGGILGALGGRALGALSGVFTGGEEARTVNPARDQFLAGFGGGGTGAGSGFAELAALLTTATGQAGGGDLFSALMNADTAKDFEAAVAAVNVELAKTKDVAGEVEEAITLDFGRARSIAQEFGIDLAGLGPQFERAEIGATAAQYAEELGFLIENGADVGAVLSGAANELGALAGRARATGQELPESMRPWLANLIETGQLLDGNGVKITSLAGINFSEPMAAGFDRVVGAIEELKDVLTVDLPAAARASADGISRAYNQGIRIDPIRVPVEVDGIEGVSGVPGFARGSQGIRDFGSGTLAVLHGREIVQTETQLGAMLRSAVGAGRASLGGVSVSVDARESSFTDEASAERLARRVGDAVMAQLRLQTRLGAGVY